MLFIISSPEYRISQVLILGLVVSVASTSIDLKVICNTTSYPDSCYDALSPVVESLGANNIGLQEVYKLSIGVAIDEVSVTSHELLRLKKQFKNIIWLGGTLNLCYDFLYNHAVKVLNDCLAVAPLDSNNPLSEMFDDLKTWLSAAAIYHQLCIDAIDEQPGDNDKLRRSVMQILNKSIQLTSNSLAILYTTFEKSIPPHAETKSSTVIPTWISSRDRMLLLDIGTDKTWYDIVVAQDGSGNYKTIGEAINAAPSNSDKRFVIYVKAGVYNEIVKVDSSKINIMMVGDGMRATIVTGNLSGPNTVNTATFTVDGKGFIARDMKFENTAGAEKGQAVALVTGGDDGVYFRCSIAGYQDTLFAQIQRQFFYKCVIHGTVDFIFGYSAAVFYNSTLLVRTPLAGQENVITAQGKNEPGINSGFSFIHCKILPDGNLTGVSTFLGRPWKDYSTTVFLYTEMGSLIDPKGWMPLQGGNSSAPDTIYYGECHNSGPGSSTDKRVSWKGLHLAMSDSEVDRFGINAFIKGRQWIPKSIWR